MRLAASVAGKSGRDIRHIGSDTLRERWQLQQQGPDGTDRIMANVRHKWERRSTEDGKGYLKCTACGKDRYEVDFEHHDHGIAGGSPG